jgi:hypothetical protein
VERKLEIDDDGEKQYVEARPQTGVEVNSEEIQAIWHKLEELEYKINGTP